MQKYLTNFDTIQTGAVFIKDGYRWKKQSTRTAVIVSGNGGAGIDATGYRGYFRNRDKCEVTNLQAVRPECVPVENETLDNYCSGRFLTFKGWEALPGRHLSEDDLYQLIALLCKRCRPATVRAVANALKAIEDQPSIGLFSRVTKDDGRWSYCAGQDYPSEIATLRKHLAGQ